MINDIQRRIDILEGAINYYGYEVSMEPILGAERLFASNLEAALSKIETRWADVARIYKTRGKSRRALLLLHLGLPDPDWGVDLPFARRKEIAELLNRDEAPHDRCG